MKASRWDIFDCQPSSKEDIYEDLRTQSREVMRAAITSSTKKFTSNQSFKPNTLPQGCSIEGQSSEAHVMNVNLDSMESTQDKYFGSMLEAVIPSSVKHLSPTYSMCPKIIPVDKPCLSHRVDSLSVLPKMESHLGIETKVIECSVPQGTLGIIIDTTNGSIPTIYSIERHSPIRDKVKTGDLLISINNIDTKDMTAQNVYRLVTSLQYERRTICIVRHVKLV